MHSDPVIIGIATFDGPGRRASLMDTLTSLEKQADRIVVYMNDYADSALSRFFSNVLTVFGPNENAGDIGDIGKFWPHFEGANDAYCLTCDDDLIYPPDYVETIIRGIEKYDRKAVVGLHGWDAMPSQRSYHRGRAKNYHCRANQDLDAYAHVIGTGACGWHSSTLSGLNLSHFHYPNMADLWFSMFCNGRGIRRVVLAHRGDYLRLSDKLDHAKDTIWAWNVGKEAVQTQALNSVEWSYGA